MAYGLHVTGPAIMLLPIKTAATCPACSKLIEAGAMVSWSPGAPAIHALCELDKQEQQRRANWRAEYRAECDAKNFAYRAPSLDVFEYEVIDGETRGTILAIGPEEAEALLRKRIKAAGYTSKAILLPKLQAGV